MDSKIVSVYQVRGHMEGEIIKTYLEAHGIPTGLAQESAGITYGLTFGSLGLVDVLVNEADAEKACQLLEDYEAGKSDPE